MVRQEYDKHVGSYSPEGRIYQYKYAGKSLQSIPGLIFLRLSEREVILVRVFNTLQESVDIIQQGYIELSRGIRMFCVGIPLDVTLFMNAFQSEFISEHQIFRNSGTPLRSFNTPLAVSLARTTANLMRVCSVGGFIIVSRENDIASLRFNLQSALITCRRIETIGLIPEEVLVQLQLWETTEMSNLTIDNVNNFFIGLNTQNSHNYQYNVRVLRGPQWDYELNQPIRESGITIISR